MDFRALAKDAMRLQIRMQERIVRETAAQAAELPPQWDVAFPQEVQDAVSVVFPTIEYNPYEEGYDEFCERMPESEHALELYGENLRVSRVVRTVDDDGDPHCSMLELVQIEQVKEEDGSVGYIVFSEFMDDAYRPVIEIHATVDALAEALAASDDWLSAYLLVHEFDYDAIEDEEAKARLVEVHLKVYEDLLTKNRWSYIQLWPEARRELQDDANGIQRMILHIEDE
jgi:hypothetical protein